MRRVIGVESAHGFGDCLFNVPLIKALAARCGCPVGVAVEAQCADAFANITEVGEIVYIPQMRHGLAALANLGYQQVHQLTQNEKFFEFRELDPAHSLIDTPRLTGQQLGLEIADYRPQLALTAAELATATTFPADKPIIIIESIYKSGQSWSDQQSLAMIAERYRDSHRIIWASSTEAGSRREIIAHLQRCERFFSVGSGFFCASLALPTALQPPEIVCLWRDELYRYEGRLTELQWHPKITWVHNRTELMSVL